MKSTIIPDEQSKPKDMFGKVKHTVTSILVVTENTVNNIKITNVKPKASSS